ATSRRRRGGGSPARSWRALREAEGLEEARALGLALAVAAREREEEDLAVAVQHARGDAEAVAVHDGDLAPGQPVHAHVGAGEDAASLRGEGVEDGLDDVGGAAIGEVRR